MIFFDLLNFMFIKWTFHSKKIVIVKINVTFGSFYQQSFHFRIWMFECTTETCVCFLTRFLFHNCGKTEINEDILLQGRTPHDVFWFHISMHNTERMHEWKWVIQSVEWIWLSSFAYFHCKDNRILKHQQIESKHIAELGTHTECKEKLYHANFNDRGLNYFDIFFWIRIVFSIDIQVDVFDSYIFSIEIY